MFSLPLLDVVVLYQLLSLILNHLQTKTQSITSMNWPLLAEAAITCPLFAILIVGFVYDQKKQAHDACPARQYINYASNVKLYQRPVLLIVKEQPSPCCSLTKCFAVFFVLPTNSGQL